MKIYVDKMPNTVEECMWSTRHSNVDGNKWYGCRLATISCSDVSKCRFFVELPTINNAPQQVYGQWIFGEYDIPHCSECGYEPNHISPYCPECGAFMEPDSEEV